MGKRDKDEIILKVSTSRKLYLPFYLMILFLGALLIFLYFNDYKITDLTIGVFVIFVFLVFNVTETHRMNSSYAITPNDILCKYGIVSKKYVRLDYYAISDLGVNQNFWQRIFGYGDVEIKLFSKDNSVLIKNINKPSLFVREIEKVMREKRQ